MEVDFTEGAEIVGLPVIQMKHLHHDPKRFRMLIGDGGTFLLTNNFTPVAVIRPLSEEDLEADDQKKEGTRAEVMTLEMLRENRDIFLFTLMKHREVFLFYRNPENREKAMALISPEIPAKILEAYGTFRDMQLQAAREKRDAAAKAAISKKRS